MPNLDLPILVVDDAKFSSVMVSRALRNAGYRDVRMANNASDALILLEDRPVSLLIADWLMPEMDGLQLTDKVRQQDEQSSHYTYVILLTAKESVEALVEAFDRGVDDFIYKSDMSKQLLPRVYAADRIANRQNKLLNANRLLTDNNRQLKSRNTIDVETGLPNDRYGRKRLEQALNHTEARGGATAYLLLGIRNWQSLRQQHSRKTMQELANSFGRRLTDLVRPLDALCRISENQFAVIAYFPNAEHCSTTAFRRLQEGVNHKAFKTTAGFVSVEASLALCVANDKQNLPSAGAVGKAATKALMSAYETNTLTETRVTVTDRPTPARQL